jgi:hypothetical protein
MYVCMFVCIYVCMCGSVAPEWLDVVHSYLVFMSLSITGQCSVSMDILVANTEVGADKSLAL